MSLSKGENLLLNIIRLEPGIGKTAVMKIMYILQEVKGVKTGYDFSIYTYGPYAAEIMEDIDDLSVNGYISCSMYPSHTYIGYKLIIKDQGEKAITQLNGNDTKALKDVVEFAENKTAKELELYSTIIYADRLIRKNSWESSLNNLTKMVHEMKPHFNDDHIHSAYHLLKTNNYVS